MSQGTQPMFDTAGELRAYDGSGAPVSLVPVPFANGDIKISGLGRRLNELVPVFVRGRFVGAGYGERRIPTITVTETIMRLVAAAAAGPMRDFLTGTGSYSANQSTLGTGRPYCVKIECKYFGAQFGDTDDMYTLNNVHFEYDFAEGRPNTHAWTGMVLGTVMLNGAIVAQEISATGV